jgi:hypothetical protein
MKLWGAEKDQTLLDKETTRFDRCGFKKPEYLSHLTELSYIHPSTVFIELTY